MMSIATRITKLEARGGPGEIPIWCDDEADVPATINAMIAELMAVGAVDQNDGFPCLTGRPNNIISAASQY